MNEKDKAALAALLMAALTSKNSNIRIHEVDD